MLDYTKNKTWDYILNADYTLKAKNINFGYFEAYGVGEYKDKLLIKGEGNILIIYKGYAWDGCTGVPSYDWNLEASLVHDVLYQVKKCPNGEACKANWWQVDRLFLSMMKNLGASWIQRNTYYMGVCVFGSIFKIEKFNSLTIIDKN